MKRSFIGKEGLDLGVLLMPGKNEIDLKINPPKERWTTYQPLQIIEHISIYDGYQLGDLVPLSENYFVKGWAPSEGYYIRANEKKAAISIPIERPQKI